jgi:hypothetical protein
MRVNLGLKPYVHNPLFPQLRAVLHGVKTGSVPDDFDWADGLPSDVGMLGNDDVGDCVIANAFHQDSVWLQKTSKIVNVDTTENALRCYSEATGYVQGDETTDQGTDMQAFIRYWATTGIPVGTDGGRRKIIAGVETDPRHLDDLQLATFECGGASIGVMLRKNILPELTDPPDVWDFDPNAEEAGLHCVTLTGRKTSQKLWPIISWGQNGKYFVTDNFLQNCLSMSFGIISGEFVNGYTGKTPLGLGLDEWQARMEAVKQQPQ